MAQNSHARSLARQAHPKQTLIHRDLGALLVLVAFCALIYGSLVFTPFLWDDVAYIQNQFFFRDWRHWAEILVPSEFFLRTGQTAYRPVPAWSFFLNYWLWGMAPTGWKAFTLALHAVNSFLVYRVTRLLWENRSFALAAALLFAAHPVHHEALACATFHTDLLCTLFMLLALNFDLRLKGGSWRSALCLALALLSKEMAAVYLPLIWTLGALRGQTENLRSFGRRHWSTLAVTGAYFACRFTIFRNPVEGRVASQALTIPKYFLLHLKLALLPYPLAVDHVVDPVTDGSDPTFWLGLLVLGLVVAFVLKLPRRPSQIRLGLGWFLITLLPVLGFLPLWNPFAERYQYLPSIGIAWFLAGVLGALPKKAAWGTIALVLIAYAAIVTDRNANWKSGLALWQNTVAVEPRSDRAHAALGRVYFDRGNYAEAEKEYLAAASLNPARGAIPLNNLGLIYMNRGATEQAIRFLTASAQAGPTYADPHVNLGILYEDQKNPERAIAEYRRAIELAPEMPEAHVNLGDAYARLGRLDLAQAELREAIRLNPGFAVAHANLGTTYLQLGDSAQALSEFETALRLEPGLIAARYGMGLYELKQGHRNAAIQIFQSVLAENPRHEEARRKLAELSQ